MVPTQNFHSIRDSIVASIPACHHWQSAGDPGSIPGRGASISFSQERLCGLYQVRTLACLQCPRHTRGISSNGRAAALHAAGKGIDAPILHFWLEWLSPAHSQHTLGDVAQMVERVLSMHEVMGSMPIFSTPFLFTRKHHSGFSTGFDPQRDTLLHSRPFSSVGRAQVS